MPFFNLYCTKKCIFVEKYSGLKISNYVPICEGTIYFSTNCERCSLITIY